MPGRWEPSLEDYIDVAAYLLGADRAAVAALPRLPLADSALHASFASFGGIEAYPTLIEQAAVLLQHVAKVYCSRRSGASSLAVQGFGLSRARGRHGLRRGSATTARLAPVSDHRGAL